ncbi:disulfide bond formation protein B [Salmonella enterica subsp. enterica serovar Enteritidis str. 22558]|nr:disulfide bond formation protein B [Salmonella enterica subsp. enterica serovar Enteritidis str. 22558]
MLQGNYYVAILNQCSRGRGAWLLMALPPWRWKWWRCGSSTSCYLNLACYVLRTLRPVGVMGAGLVGAIAPKTPLRYVAMVIWIYSAWRGLQLAYEHTMIQLHPSPFMTCDFMARFPDWLPLGKWLPQVFVASGDCAERQWSFLTLEMPQWLLGIFAAYLVVAIAVVIAQAFKPKKRDLFGR